MTQVRFHRRLLPVSVISFDLDDTLYDNGPVMQAAEQQVQDFICQYYPQTKDWDIKHWQQRRLKLMREHESLRSDMTRLRLATLEQGFTEAQVLEPKRAAETVMQQFLFHRSNFSVAASTHELLRSLARQFRLVAVSNGNVDCDRIGLSQHFQLIVQPGDGLRGKPFSDMFERVKAELDVKSEQILHIGDHPISDVVGAQRSGCQSAWFTGGLGKHEQLSTLPTFQFDQLNDLELLNDTGCTYSG